MQLKRLCLILQFLLVFSNQFIQAQQYNPFYSHFGEFKTDAKDHLFFRVENLNFIKNNEYSGKFAKGETYIGYVTTPKLVYYPSSDFRIEAGVRLQKYSGLSNFSEAEPVFSIHYQTNDRLSFNLGSLNQEDNHHLHEALFEPERYFTDKVENGLQVLYNSTFLKADAWINWEKFIFQNDPFNEVFSFGFVADLRLNNPTSDYSLSVPMQVLFTHRGGEIDTSNKNKQTIRNLVAGVSFKKTIHNARLKKYELEVLGFKFKDNSSVKEFVFGDGTAFHFRLGATTKHSDLKLGYWISNKFNSARGSALFQSLSVIDNTYTKARRDMFTGKYRIQKSIATGILLGGQIDAYLDMNSEHDFSFATSVFVRINGEFFLKKIKWN
ncbi:hypothetical protein EO244_08045 [Ancylomarina salipaludis]|uniref:DUF4421 domain-containing protein n=1 Tax=Ancylomarina salipaludis TaxID=2501299 RepID=A0A4Q1JLQ8_9BACT|nr:hypothetical protein [Ancylomarina salipaludis]RXQ94994.1 hypothetical protein EO244_08045 [Ancylomarina salipaludis]